MGLFPIFFFRMTLCKYIPKVTTKGNVWAIIRVFDDIVLCQQIPIFLKDGPYFFTLPIESNNRPNFDFILMHLGTAAVCMGHPYLFYMLA